MPDWNEIVKQRIASLHLKPEEEMTMSEEMAQHLEDRFRDLCREGLAEDRATEEALAEMDDLAPLKAASRKRRAVASTTPVAGGNYFGDLLRDLRYALRTWRKNPLFTFFVVATLALGIGANTTVFTVVNTLVLKPLPIPDTESLASIGTVETKKSAKGGEMLPLSLANFEDYAARNRTLQTMAGYTSPHTVTLRSGGETSRMFAELVTGTYFATLGLVPAHGRYFSAEESRMDGEHPVAVMNHATWQGRFGGRSDIVGRNLTINNVVVTVIGVAPPRFLGVDAIFGPDLWIPASMAERLMPVEMRGALKARSKAEFLALGRLKPGVTMAQARSELATIGSALAREYPETNEGHIAGVQTIHEAFFGTAGGRNPVVFGSIVLLAVVGLVLLIACSNVANLLLARSAARQGEIAVRLAIGASRGRLIRQLLTESGLLGLAGGAAGFLLGYSGTRILWSFLPGEFASNLRSPQTDGAVFAYTLAMSLATALVFGTMPAIRASRISVAEKLKEEARTAGRARTRISFANVLLVGQVAFSFLSLVVAALFLRSIERACAIDPGFQTAHLAIFSTNPGQAGFNETRTRAFYKDLRERVERLPGVASASWSSNLPLWAGSVTGIDIAGRAQRSRTERITAVLNTVDVDYFQTMDIPVLDGRAFRVSDRAEATPVAIVNQKMARDYWPGMDAVGKRIRLPGEQMERQIAGVVRNANYTNLAEAPQPCVYIPLAQKYAESMNLYVKSKGNPDGVMTAVRQEAQAVLPGILMTDVRTGRTIVGQSLFTARMGVSLLGVFGLLALGLASIGLYGIMTYSVNLRHQEIGLRMALGAEQTSVMTLILRQGMGMVAIGVAVGLALSFGAGQLLSGLLFGVSLADPISVLGAASVLLTVASIACFVPAYRASRIDPLLALREG